MRLTFLCQAPIFSLLQVKDTAQGVAYLHSQSCPIVHGDLSPDNILIRIIDDVPTAALSEFGLSRVVNEFGGHTGLTTGDAGGGTPGYMAKELIMGESLATRMSDVYALAGVILFVSGLGLTFARGTETDTPLCPSVLGYERRGAFLQEEK